MSQKCAPLIFKCWFAYGDVNYFMLTLINVENLIQCKRWALNTRCMKKVTVVASQRWLLVIDNTVR